MNTLPKPFVRRRTAVFTIFSASMILLSTTAIARDACDSLSSIDLAAPVPKLDCQANKHDVYEQSVMNAVFKAKQLHLDVDDKVAAVKNGLTDEQLQQSYTEHVSDDSNVRGRVRFHNKTDLIVNYSTSPESRAEQSVGAIR